MKKMSFILAVVLVLGAVLSLSSCKNEEPKNKAIEVEEVPTDRALTLLDSLITVEPRNADLYYDRALYYREAGISPKAIADIYSALHIDSANVDYYLLAGELFLDMGDGQKAVALMSKGINLNPESEVLYIKAIQYNYYLQNFEAALNFSNDLLAKNKYNAEVYFLKGLIFKEMRNDDKAISSFQTCTEVDPTYYNAYMQLGLLYSAKGDDVSVQYFENAIRLDENSREAYYAIAYHFQRKKEFSKAVSNYKKMITKDPKDHEVFFNLGHCYIGLDSLNKAYNHFDLATQIHPQYAGAYYMKGNVSEISGNKEDALINYQLALNMLPNDSTIMAAIQRVKE